MAKAKRRKKATNRKKVTKKRTRKVAKRGQRVTQAPRPRAVAGSADTAVRALRAHSTALVAQRAQLDAEIQAVDEALRVMGAAGAKAGRRATGPRGGRRAGSLKEYIAKVLNGSGVMTVKAITEGVLAAGYPTRNRTLAKSVGITLTKMNEVKRVKRGHFRMR